ncbi:glycosyltransferase [Halosegnis marinus]|uniref:Glycosyltransferase n=1 Tax=Halosegnis marinus TaxID=3034023 RepID=A0ABD5ZQS0_9EURY|nr:glycosyltransferase [Halosegnis sp. DT85]
MDCLSVVIPTYENDDPGDLAKALKSVLDQTVPPDEVVVVGDGPLTAELKTTVARFEEKHPKRVKLFQLPENRGKGKARQEGVKRTTNDIVAMMDADDICRRDRFELQLEYLNTNLETDVVGSYFTEFDPDSEERYAVREVPERHEEIASVARYRSPINQATVMFRKEPVMEVGNYEDVRRLEDYRLWVRLLVNGATFGNIPESLVHVRAGENMHERRGGMAYARSEIGMQYDFYRWGFIPLWLAVFNAATRVVVRTLPNRLRGAVYEHLLRANPEEHAQDRTNES